MKCLKQIKVVFVCICVVLLIVKSFLCLNEQFVASNESTESVLSTSNHLENDTDRYDSLWINGPNCKIPNLSPFSKDAKKVFKRMKPETCFTKRPLTSIEQNFTIDEARLVIYKDRITDYIAEPLSALSCCYHTISRYKAKQSPDDEIRYSTCKSFTSSIILAPDSEFVYVTCKKSAKKTSDFIYKNAHAIIRSKEHIKKKFKKASKQTISVVMMGIDSISRLNLIRAMPKTYQHLEEQKWFELRGYNKMGENTYPNLMAILTGQNEHVSYKACRCTIIGGLDNCKFIWKDFSSAGYATAYAEDEAEMNTFNYKKKGFVNPPTDYYFRPFALAVEEKLKHKRKYHGSVCMGYQHYADYVYQYGFDFAAKYRNDPFFGFFWTNSFSHGDLSMPSSMDHRVKQYLEQLQTLGTLNSSIVIFFSDHGIRFGPIRQYFTGWLEERLPFFYIWLPEKFKLAHPEVVKNLQINRDRLSSPYDVHVTLKHILQMSGGYKKAQKLSAISCPKCQSLFEELPLNRSCSDAGIDAHWCACNNYNEINKTSQVVQSAIKFAVGYINNALLPYPKCAKLYLRKVLSARKSIQNLSSNYLVSFDVMPSLAELETIVTCEDGCKQFHIDGSILRLNRYNNQSWCVDDFELRKYCFCL